MVAASSSVGGQRLLTVLFWRAVWRADWMVVTGRSSSIFDSVGDGVVVVASISWCESEKKPSDMSMTSKRPR